MASVDHVGIHHSWRYRGRLLGLALAVIARDEDKRLSGRARHRANSCHWSCRHDCVLLRSVPSVIVATTIPPQTDRVGAMTKPPNHALQRTRPSRPGCNPTPSWAGSLSLGRSARQCSYSPDDYLTDCRDNFFATIFLPLVVAHMPSDSMAKKCRAKNQLPTKTVETMEASRTLQNESQTLSASARFVCNAGCLTGGSDTLQASLAKSWIALPCIHADINRHRVAARHQDSYNDRGSIRRTDNSNA